MPSYRAILKLSNQFITLKLKLKINQLEPNQLIEQDNSSTAYTFQHLRGNKLVTCKTATPIEPQPQAFQLAHSASLKLPNSPSFKLPQVTISQSPPPHMMNQTLTNSDSARLYNQHSKNNTYNPDSSPLTREFKSFSCCSYQSFKDESERTKTNLLLGTVPDPVNPFVDDSKITFEAIKKLNEPLGRKKVEIIGKELNEQEGDIKKSKVNVKENLKEKKLTRFYSQRARSPTRLRLENTLPKLREKETTSYLANYLANSVRTTKIEQQRESEFVEKSVKKNVILGPDGEVSKIGISLNQQLADLQREKRDEKERQAALYKLEDGGVPPPYLYYSNKLASDVDIEYGNLLDRPFGEDIWCFSWKNVFY